MTLGFDGEPQVRSATCAKCGREFPFVSAFLTDDGTAAAIVYAACHTHNERAEAWLDVVVGSFDERDFADQATFSCRVRSRGATLFSAPVAAEGRAAFFGKKLSADEAGTHELLPAVWAAVDFVVTSEPTIKRTLFGTDGAP